MIQVTQVWKLVFPYFPIFLVTFLFGCSASVLLPSSLLSSSSSVYKEIIVADGSIGYWKLSEASGTVAMDQIRQNNGTYQGISGTDYRLADVGALLKESAGNFGLRLTGFSGYLRVPYSSSYGFGAGDFTFELWFNKINSMGLSRGELLSWQGNSATPSFEVYMDLGSVLKVGLQGTQISSGNFQVTEGVWHHLVVLRSSTSLSVFVDAVLYATGTLASSVNFDSWNNVPVWVGAMNSNSSPTNVFAGTLDELAVYNRALTPVQIKAHYQAGVSSN